MKFCKVITLIGCAAIASHASAQAPTTASKAAANNSADHAAAVALSDYPLNNNGLYFGVGGGAVVIDRNPVLNGRRDGGTGRNREGTDPTDWSPAADAKVGYRFNDVQAAELTYFGTWVDTANTIRSDAFSSTAIDGSGNVSRSIDGVASIHSKYTEDVHDLGAYYLHRLCGNQNYNVTGRAGIAGGFFDQEFQQHSVFNGELLDQLKETVDNNYIGPRIGFDSRFALCHNVWLDFGTAAGAMFGFADLNAKETQFAIQGGETFHAKDSMNYVSARLSGNLGLEWSPCTWSVIQVGYRVEWWSNSPQIVNPAIDTIGPKAHLDSESVLVHGAMLTVTLRLP